MKAGGRVKINKIIKISIILMLMILFFCSINVFAEVADPIKNPSAWQHEPNTNPVVTDKVGKMLGTISLIGALLSAIIAAVIGIKYMVGSIEEKADYKKSLIPYLIGCVLIVAASTLPKIIYELVTSVLN